MALYKIKPEDVARTIKTIERIEQDCKPNRIAYVLQNCQITQTPVIGCQAEYAAVIENTLRLMGIWFDDFINLQIAKRR